MPSFRTTTTTALAALAALTAANPLPFCAVEYVYADDVATSASATATDSIATSIATSTSAPATSSVATSKNSVKVASSSATTSGTATFYGGNTEGGQCLFSGYTIPSGLYGTAFSGSAWDGASHCGECLKVTGPLGTVTVMVVDQCPECDATHLDLFEDAFAAIGDKTKGTIDISFESVACGITDDIVLKNKEGTSAYWFSMQARNLNLPVESLEVSTDGGSSWQATTRSEYNFFENQSGFGTETVDVRITSQSGEQIVVNDMAVTAGLTKAAGGNF
ncbi:carbohydrate-binding module family 63 protein [Aplosporella prunicola CBS 121167]|uniref:Carbohydrate-binding module family 63 protein n=1 Tax=Aplosporella prunicola CBS 121167 TaxID=1176127 RepID=A0A6A6AZA1_9PEZI|nr:carbohydrate-binding module family 63 protein [Aplosporella prunicola CBS 121167]KAF2137110.1 carbohydrate-binding module family 63 protein [Aplosporella prunicola CBS 121167]